MESPIARSVHKGRAIIQRKKSVCLADNNDQWWALLNTANNNWVTKRQVIPNMKDLNTFVEYFWLRSLSGTNRFDVKFIS
jgi:hypothetical protein